MNSTICRCRSQCRPNPIHPDMCFICGGKIETPNVETNRFRAIIPNAIPWRERRDDDALIGALMREGATDAEAIDVLAADRERLRADVVRLLQFQPPPAIVLEGVRASNAAVLAEREACADAIRAMRDVEEPGTERRNAFAEAVIAITSRK